MVALKVFVLGRWTRSEHHA